MISEKLKNQLKKNEAINSIKADTEFDKKIVFLLKEITGIFCFEVEYEPFKYLKTIKCDTEIINCLEQISDNFFGYSLKARINDFVWQINKKKENLQKACELYYESIITSDNYEENKTDFNRLINLYNKSDKKIICKEKIDGCVQKMLDMGKSDKTAKYLHILEACYKYRFVSNDELIKITENKMQEWKSLSSLRIIEGYNELLEKLYGEKNNITNLKTKTNNIDLSNNRRKMASIYLSYVEEKNNNAICNVYYIKKAIGKLNFIVGASDEIRKLSYELVKEEQDMVSQMQINEYSLNVDMYSILKEELKKLNKEEVICYLAMFIPWVTKKQIIERIKDEEKFVFSKLFPKSIVDKNGKQRAKLHPHVDGKYTEEEMYFNLKFEYAIHVQTLIIPVVRYIRETFSVEEEMLNRIFKSSWIIPEKSRESFTKGILAGFKNDFITANSILIPLTEKVVRNLAQELGTNVYRISDEQGNEEVISLNNILNSEILKEVLDEELIFNLIGIFTSDYGFNFRNDFAHGLLDDEDFKSIYAFLPWWTMLKLCYTFSKLENYGNICQKLKK